MTLHNPIHVPWKKMPLVLVVRLLHEARCFVFAGHCIEYTLGKSTKNKPSFPTLSWLRHYDTFHV